MSGRPLALLADIGGTNLRWALLEAGGTFSVLEIQPTASHAGLEEATTDLLARHPELARLKAAAFDVACPVTGDEVQLTNLPWRFSRSAVAARFGFAPCIVVNDLVAIARGAAEEGTAQRTALKRGVPAAAAVAVIAPGTGLGVAGLMPRSQGWHAMASEGGHVSLAPDQPDLVDLVTRLRRTWGPVAAEDLLSAPGLHLLYRTLAGKRASLADPAAVSAAARTGDPLALRALEAYARLLGGFVADMVMAFDARGGALIAGDLLTRLGRGFDRKAFVAGFLDKGRYHDYLAPIPIGRVRAKHPALIGLAAFLRDAGVA